jgi:hypothetical protein
MKYTVLEISDDFGFSVALMLVLVGLHAGTVI